ncbi:thermonuclease family protein [Campylobacter sp. MIT 97-5078]|uniref:thermonuclease family protein n=1 Tax=Campylobacter sp. MIT 97-5078 TaxID=1548153 RepID=UPI0005147D06|nr:thermonuclease family protein [Campylobacter sp. MIT 97-5078]KGI56158.1 nuclease [Campylobacter sp. MIT 97-5078]TQR27957.1 thermonuclease family protein [Campylobacter sp. MIT 97-5078]
MKINYKNALNLRKAINDPKRLILLLIAFGLIFLLNSFASYNTSFKAQVVRVIDGDTIEVLDKNKKNYRVRFFGIDAPESNQAFGKKSKEFLASLVAGKEVKIIKKDTDKYNRTLAVIELEGKDINKIMVENGFAWAYSYYTEAYVAEQNLAKSKKLGLWADKKPIEPYKWRKTHSFKEK